MFIGYIYKITGACGSVYIGSTADYKTRERAHLSSNNTTSSKLLEKPLVIEIIRQDEYKLIKTMRLVEQYYLDNAINCINYQRAYYGNVGAKLEKEKDRIRAKKYAETHKDEKREYDKNYRKIHKEAIAKYKKKYAETHKEEKREYLKNYYEINKEKIKKQKLIYDETHKEERKAKRIVYREKHKEAIAKYRKDYYEKHKEKFNEKIECKYCKALISKKSMSRHLKKTKRCLAIQNSLNI